MRDPRERLSLDLRYGRGSRRVSIPNGFKVRVVEPKNAQAFRGSTVSEALAHPIGSPRLADLARGCRRVAVVVNDITRMVGTSEFLPAVLEELAAGGVREDGISILVATGAHRGHTPEEHRLIVGDAVWGNIRVHDHDCTDRGNMRFVGTTTRGNSVFLNRIAVEADLTVLTGEITYHYAAGYTGGRKSVMPGIASYESIRFNHQVMDDPACRPGSLQGNPLHEDAVEAAGFLSPLFIVNVIRDPEGKLVHSVAGHYRLAHEEGCRWVDALYRVDVGERFDVVLASCGGLPKDIDLYQAHKGLENACALAKAGGEVVLLAQCPDGLGGERFATVAREGPPFEELRRRFMEHFDLGIHKAYRLAKLAGQCHIILISEIERGPAKNLGIEVSADVDGVLEGVFTRVRRGGSVAIMPEASLTFPF